MLSDPTALDRVENAARLLGHGFVIYTSCDSLQHAIHDQEFELLILDATLPSGVSMTLAHWLRLHLRTDAPVAWLAPQTATDDPARESGDASKLIPASLNVLQTAQAIKRLLHANHRDRPAQLRFGNYLFIPTLQEVRFGGLCVTLKRREFELALFMFRNLGTLVSRIQILDAIWSPTTLTTNSRSIDTHMSRIRTHLRLSPENGLLLSATYKEGYRLEQVSMPSLARFG